MSRVIALRGTVIATWIVALIVVCLRFTARRLSKSGFWYDDWLMIPAAVSFLFLSIHHARWIFQAHAYVSSFLGRYALVLLCAVSHLSCAEDCSMDCHELTSSCYATVPSQWDHDTEGFNNAVTLLEICWALVIWIVKSSILTLYWRLFNARSRSFRFVIWALGAFVACWAITMVSYRLSNPKLVTIGNFEPRRQVAYL